MTSVEVIVRASITVKSTIRNLFLKDSTTQVSENSQFVPFPLPYTMQNIFQHWEEFLRMYALTPTPALHTAAAIDNSGESRIINCRTNPFLPVSEKYWGFGKR